MYKDDKNKLVDKIKQEDIIMTEMQANAQGAEANATQDLGDGATAEVVKWKSVGQDGSEREVEVPLEDLKAAWDKKLTNQDKFFQKKSMEHAKQMKDVESMKAEYSQAIDKMNSLYSKMSAQGQQSVDNINSGEFNNQDIDTVLKQLNQFVSKTVADTIGDKLKKIDELDSRYKEQGLKSRAADIERNVAVRFDKVGLEPTDREEFLYRFMGKHNVANMPAEDGYDDRGNYVEGFFSVFDKELAGWTKVMKEKGLLSTKQYVDSKEDKNKRFSTDARGVRGTELKVPDKGATVRQHRDYKKQVMSNLAEKYFGKNANRG